MKKILITLLAACLLMSLAACSSSAPSSQASTVTPEVETAPEPTAEPEKSEEETGIVGNDTLGCLDYSAYTDHFVEVDDVDGSIVLVSTDKRCTITIELLGEVSEGTLEDAADKIWHDLEAKGFTGIKGAKAAIGERDALQIYCEREYEDFDGQILTTVCYATTNDHDQYVGIRFRGPQNLWEDENGNVYHPDIFDLKDLAEKNWTFSK